MQLPFHKLNVNTPFCTDSGNEPYRYVNVTIVYVAAFRSVN